ncbi:MAG: hypothetical protein M3384_08435 [Acidobacteriota bacterium]|nr:hypothetical protein [Acidobacteriota bacterium]
MNAERRDKWKKIRQKEQFRFILSGFFLYGLGGTFLSTLIDYSFEFFFNDASNYPHASDRSFSKILFRLIVFSLVGFSIKYSEWNKNEEEFFRNPEER